LGPDGIHENGAEQLGQQIGLRSMGVEGAECVDVSQTFYPFKGEVNLPSKVGECKDFGGIRRRFGQRGENHHVICCLPGLLSDGVT
jgi:hypothetical protein